MEARAVGLARLIVRAYLRECLFSVCYRLESFGRLRPLHQEFLLRLSSMLGYFLDSGLPRDQAEALTIGLGILRHLEHTGSPENCYLYADLGRLLHRCQTRR